MALGRWDAVLARGRKRQRPEWPLRCVVLPHAALRSVFGRLVRLGLHLAKGVRLRVTLSPARGTRAGSLQVDGREAVLRQIDLDLLATERDDRFLRGARVVEDRDVRAVRVLEGERVAARRAEAGGAGIDEL